MGRWCKLFLAMVFICQLLLPSEAGAGDGVEAVRIGFLPLNMAKYERNLSDPEMAKPEEYYIPFLNECLMMLENRLLQGGFGIVERRELEALDAERVLRLSEYSEAAKAAAGVNADFLILPEGLYFQGRLYLRLSIFRTADSKQERIFCEVDFRAPRNFVEKAVEKITQTAASGKNVDTVEPSRSVAGGVKGVLAIIPAVANRADNDMSAIMTEVSNCIFSGSNAFRLVERGRVKECIAELRLSETGLVDHDVSVKIGGMLGADFLMLCGMRSDSEDLLKLDLRMVNCKSGAVLASVQKDCTTAGLERELREFLSLCEKGADYSAPSAVDDKEKRRREIEFLKNNLGESAAAFLETDADAIDLHLALMYMSHRDWPRAIVHLKKLANLDRNKNCDQRILNYLETAFRAQGLLRLGTPIEKLIGESKNHLVKTYLQNFVDPRGFVYYTTKTFGCCSDSFAYNENREQLYTLYYIALRDQIFSFEQKKYLIASMAKTFAVFDYRMMLKCLKDLDMLLTWDQRAVMLFRARAYAWIYGDYEKGAACFEKMYKTKRLTIEQMYEYAILLKHLGNDSKASDLIKEAKQTEKIIYELSARKLEDFTDEEIAEYEKILRKKRRNFSRILPQVKKEFIEYPAGLSEKAYRLFVLTVYISYLEHRPALELEKRQWKELRDSVAMANGLVDPHLRDCSLGFLEGVVLSGEPGDNDAVKKLFEALDKDDYFEREKKILFDKLSEMHRQRSERFPPSLNGGFPMLVSLWYDRYYTDRTIGFLEADTKNDYGRELVKLYINRHRPKEAFELIRKNNYAAPVLLAELEKILNKADTLSGKEYWSWLEDNELIYTNDGEVWFVNLAEKDLISIPSFFNNLRRGYWHLRTEFKAYTPVMDEYRTMDQQNLHIEQVSGPWYEGPGFEAAENEPEIVHVLTRLFAIDRKNRKTLWRTNTFDLVEDYYDYGKKLIKVKQKKLGDVNLITFESGLTPQLRKEDGRLVLKHKYDIRYYDINDGHLIEREYTDTMLPTNLKGKDYIKELAAGYLSKEAGAMLTVSEKQKPEEKNIAEEDMGIASSAGRGTGHYGEEYANRTLEERPWLVGDLEYVITDFYDKAAGKAKRLDYAMARRAVDKLCMLGTTGAYRYAFAVCRKNGIDCSSLDWRFLHDESLLDIMKTLRKDGLCTQELMNLVPSLGNRKMILDMVSAPHYGMYHSENISVNTDPEIRRVMYEAMPHIKNEYWRGRRRHMLEFLAEPHAVADAFGEKVEEWTSDKYLSAQAEALKYGILHKKLKHMQERLVYAKHEEMYRIALQHNGVERDCLLLLAALNGSVAAYGDLIDKHEPLLEESAYSKEICLCLLLPHQTERMLLGDGRFRKWYDSVKDRHYLTWFFSIPFHGVYAHMKNPPPLHYFSKEELEMLYRHDNYYGVQSWMDMFARELGNRGDYQYCTKSLAGYVWQVLYGSEDEPDELFSSLWWEVDRKATDWLISGDYRKNGICPK